MSEIETSAAPLPVCSNQELERLLPCPFCGGEPEMLRKGNNHRPKRSITIRCKGCRVERTDAAIRHGMDWLEHIATEHWNQRSNDAIIKHRVDVK